MLYIYLNTLLLITQFIDIGITNPILEYVKYGLVALMHAHALYYRYSIIYHRILDPIMVLTLLNIGGNIQIFNAILHFFLSLLIVYTNPPVFIGTFEKIKQPIYLHWSNFYTTIIVALWFYKLEFALIASLILWPRKMFLIGIGLAVYYGMQDYYTIIKLLLLSIIV